MEVFIRNGDSLWYLSQLFNIPLQLIIDSNPNVNPQMLAVGEQIQIPGYIATDYQIKAGDSLWSIAASRNIHLDTLSLSNPHLNPYNLQIGQTIRVPLKITWRLLNGKQNYTYEIMMDDIKRLQSVYPFLRISSIGNSVLERSIPEVVVGNGSKEVHYNGSFHANEWITTPIIMTFLNDYLLSLTNQSPMRGLETLPAYEQTLLSIVPMVNPDGVNLVINGPPDNEQLRNQLIEWNNDSTDFSDWKANINGVDLNDQFPAKWELENERNPKSPGPRDYGGTAPLTEPEAIAMADLTKERNFAHVLAFHTQGKVIYYGFEDLEPPESEVLANEFSKVSGYEPIKSAGSYADYKDWFIQDWRRPGFTIEMGKGVNPLPLTQFDEIYNDVLGIFLAALYL